MKFALKVARRVLVATVNFESEIQSGSVPNGWYSGLKSAVFRVGMKFAGNSVKGRNGIRLTPKDTSQCADFNERLSISKSDERSVWNGVSRQESRTRFHLPKTRGAQKVERFGRRLADDQEMCGTQKGDGSGQVRH